MIKGSLVPNITFFKKDNTIDYDKCRWHMKWMFDNGVHGLFLTGSYGAGPLMTNEERISIFKLAKEVKDQYEGKFLIAHVGCADTDSTVALAKAAEEIGVDALGAVPPFYYTYTEDRVIEYYRAIASAVKIPVYAYNNPFTTKTTMTLKTVLKLQEAGVKGVKDSSMNVAFITNVFYDAKINRKDFKTIIGTSTGWLPFSTMGIDTMIAGMCNYAPEIISAMYEYTIKGDMEKAEKAYRIMMEYSGKCKFVDSTIASHMILKARGFDCGLPRLPMSLPQDSDPKYAELKADFEKAYAAIKALEGSETAR
ncbi:dihydrodipicolinate synthase family protein [Anaerotruncus rubiinfantis]|uniref:dihydrodipicolinate synthase family protein n=1 Tax=Anaerotruncus rubiinfantis TaxID=1720200 RepID=UPI000835E41B|nr:dihydrodipicolinate synthase family protein [Anaerotruncus rubiinfantis]